MKYSDLTRRYFESAPHAGVIPGAGVMPGAGVAAGESGVAAGAGVAAGEGGVFRGAAGNREHGTWVQFDVQVLAQRFVGARFLAFGCPHTIATAAWVAEQAAGTVLRAALPEPVAALARRFEVPVEKLGRLLIVEDAWLSAARSALTPLGADPISSLKEL